MKEYAVGHELSVTNTMFLDSEVQKDVCWLYVQYIQEDGSVY